MWAQLVGIAVGGSLIFGVSLGLVMPDLQLARAALWLAAWTGLAWCIFGPALCLITRKSPFICAHACLVTMAYGEGVLVAGAVINLLINLAGGTGGPGPVLFNVAWVALSNLVMGVALSRQFQAVGVAPWKTLLAWILLLDGSGASFAWLLQPLLHGRIY